MENRVRNLTFYSTFITFVLLLSWEGGKNHALSPSKLTVDALVIVILRLVFKTDQQVYNALLLYLQLHGRKQHIRALLIDRVMLQHEVCH